MSADDVTRRLLAELHDVGHELRPAVEQLDELERALVTRGEPGKWADILERLDGALADSGEVLTP